MFRNIPWVTVDSVSQRSAGSQQSSSEPESGGGVVMRATSPHSAEVKSFLENLPGISGFQAARAEAIAALCKFDNLM